MAKEMIFNCKEYETRIAMLDNKTLSNLYVERTDERSIAGNIYTGKVVRVLPGMQAAFDRYRTGKNRLPLCGGCLHRKSSSGFAGFGRGRRKPRRQMGIQAASLCN